MTFSGTALVIGYKIIGKKEVTGIGIASVIHQMAIQMVAAMTLKAGSDISEGGPIHSIKKNTPGPKI